MVKSLSIQLLVLESHEESMVAKRKLTCDQQFLLPQCFQLFVIGYPFNYKDFLCFDKICSKSSAAELLYEENHI